MHRTALPATMLAIIVLIVLPAGAAAGGGGGGLGACAGFASGDTVTMRDNCFEGTAHFAGGDTITILNEGQMDHTYTAVDGAFDTGALRSGETADIDAEPGIHRVYCTLHSTPDGEGMAGVLIVGDPALAAAEIRPASGNYGLTGLVIAGTVLAAFAGVVAFRRNSSHGR